jgi:hypothetical protein
MTSESDSPVLDNGYPAATRRRMGTVIRELVAIQQAGGGDITRVLSRLDEQQKASRNAGYLPILRLCQTLADYLRLKAHLAEAPGRQRPQSPSIAAILLDVCRVIQLHADAVAKTMSYLRGHDVPAALSTRIQQLLSSRDRLGLPRKCRLTDTLEAARRDR